jgi:biopolymer transport protein ExbB
MPRRFADATSGLSQFGIDPTGPTGGSFLAAIIDTPTLEERWHQGGYVGYAITAVGVFAFLLAIARVIMLTMMGAAVNSQLKSGEAKTNNPLGRVLLVSQENPNIDTETLELKMAEAVLRETPKTRGWPHAAQDHRCRSAADGSIGYGHRV